MRYPSNEGELHDVLEALEELDARELKLRSVGVGNKYPSEITEQIQSLQAERVLVFRECLGRDIATEEPTLALL